MAGRSTRDDVRKAREGRLREALRENLKRRKAQARARREEAGEGRGREGQGNGESKSGEAKHAGRAAIQPRRRRAASH